MKSARPEYHPIFHAGYTGHSGILLVILALADWAFAEYLTQFLAPDDDQWVFVYAAMCLNRCSLQVISSDVDAVHGLGSVHDCTPEPAVPPSLPSRVHH